MYFLKSELKNFVKGILSWAAPLLGVCRRLNVSSCVSAVDDWWQATEQWAILK